MHYFNFWGFGGGFGGVPCSRNEFSACFQRSPRSGKGGAGTARSAVAARCKARPASIHSEHSPQNFLPGDAARSQNGQNPGRSRSSSSSIMLWQGPRRRCWRSRLRTGSQGVAASQTMIWRAARALPATMGRKTARWESWRVVQE